MRSEIELEPEQCRTLLTSGVVGRIAYWADDGPRLHPVNYAVLDESVVVRTSPDSGLVRLVRTEPGAVAAFGVDGVDHADQRGWSVQARGPLEEITEPDVIAEIERTRPPRTWAPGDRTALVRLRWKELTGRQVGSGWDPAPSAGYRRVP